MNKWMVVIALVVGLPALATPVTAVLGIKSKIPMQTFADDVKNPSSPRYQAYYTPEEIRAYAAPSQGEYDALLAQLQQEGFTVVGETATHLWVTVKADSSVFESVFSTQLNIDGRGQRKAIVPAKVPARLPLIESVVGLDNTRRAIPKYVIAEKGLEPMKKGGGGTSTGGGADNGGGLAQSTIKTAYGLAPIYAAGINASGQHIAIATYDGFTISDVSSFYSLSGLSPLPTVDQVTFNGTPAFSADSAVETELDSEFSGMIAPGAAVHVFASATNDDAGEVAIFTAILDDGRAKVVNYSWGDCETGVDSAHATAMETIFQQAVAQGVNIMVASGDSGSADCFPSNNSTTTVADFPSANANVVAVGGTSFKQSGSKLAETAWSCTTSTISDGCSGGGVSTLWPLPAYQKGVIPSKYTMRAYPDVAFNADPKTGQDVYVTYQASAPAWLKIGGTSMAAPQWTGFMALVDAARASKGLGALGFANPLWYAATSKVRGTLFNDVKTGSNGAYKAATGWDPVTGFGSMQGQNLLNFLTQQ